MYPFVGVKGSGCLNVIDKAFGYEQLTRTLVGGSGITSLIVVVLALIGGFGWVTDTTYNVGVGVGVGVGLGVGVGAL